MVNRRPSFEEAARHFEVYCQAKGLADRTVETYMFALDRLRQYLQDQPQGPSIPMKEDLRAFTRWMLDSGLSRQTIREIEQGRFSV